MKHLIHIFGYLKRVWAGVLFFTLFASFSFQLINGDRGYFAYKSLKQERIEKQNAYTDLFAAREVLERQVKGLRIQSLDLDLLDQQTRIMLNHIGRNEFILVE